MDAIRSNIEHLKIWWRKGSQGPSPAHYRGCGTTQAILEFAHELLHSGQRVAVCCGDSNLALHARLRYVQTFGDDEPQPDFIRHPDNARGTVDAILDDRPNWMQESD